MKKVLLILVSIVIVGIIVLFLLPAEQKITQAITVECPMDAVTRLVSDEKKWTTWWPGKKINDSTFEYQQKIFRIQALLLNGFKAISGRGNIISYIDFQFLPASITATQFILNTQYNFSSNPFKKAVQYISYNKAKQDYTGFVTYLQYFFSNPEKVYGYKIEKQKIIKSSLISVKQIFNHYPAVTEIYDLVNELKQYIQLQKSREMNFPIMHVHTEGNQLFEVMVAIQTDRNLPSTNRYKLKNMMPGNILVAEVTGDNQAIKRGEKEMENYVHDFKKISPAIPFQAMITDRLNEKDSSKWITKLYYPVFN